MRVELPELLMRARVRDFPHFGINGAYLINGPCGVWLKIIASNGQIPDPDAFGWEHVSVSAKKRCPNWQEMCFVKDLFWADDEVVFQLHPAKSDWISNSRYVLHMWRHHDKPIPIPPPILVGVKEIGEIRDKAHAVEMWQKYFPTTED